MVTRWDPFAEVTPMRQAINRLFDESVGRSTAWGATGTASAFPFDLYESGDTIIVRAAIPGVDQSQLELVVNQGMLLLKGYRHFYSGDEEQQHTWHVRGLTEGAFQMAVALPTAVDADAAEATYEGGLLTVQLPKAETVRAKRISIKSAPPQEALPGAKPAGT